MRMAVSLQLLQKLPEPLKKIASILKYSGLVVSLFVDVSVAEAVKMSMQGRDVSSKMNFTFP